MVIFAFMGDLTKIGEYPTYAAAARELHCTPSSIKRVCDDKLSHTHGLFFRRYEDD